MGWLDTYLKLPVSEFSGSENLFLKCIVKYCKCKYIVKHRLHVWSQAGAGDRELCIQMDICQPGTELTNFYFSFTVIVLPKTAFGSGYSYSTKVIFTAKFTTEKLVSQNMKVLYQLSHRVPARINEEVSHK